MWSAARNRLQPVPRVNRVEVGLLRGIDRVRDQLMDNTLRFAAGLPANNAMLWGARGMGKSSLVKAAHAEALAQHPGSLALIEIAREDIVTLPSLLNLLRGHDRRCLVFCDDLSFEREDADYKALKSVLDGGIEGFHNCDQPTYLAMVAGYAKALALPIEPAALSAEAIAWSAGRGGRSGRVAWQFTQDLAGRLGVSEGEVA